MHAHHMHKTHTVHAMMWERRAYGSGGSRLSENALWRDGSVAKGQTVHNHAPVIRRLRAIAIGRPAEAHLIGGAEGAAFAVCRTENKGTILIFYIAAHQTIRVGWVANEADTGCQPLAQRLRGLDGAVRDVFTGGPKVAGGGAVGYLQAAAGAPSW